MQNKPNLLYAQMNVSSVNTMNYELRTMNYFIQNEPKRTQFYLAEASAKADKPNLPWARPKVESKGQTYLKT